jgi:hypothetical protein
MDVMFLEFENFFPSPIPNSSLQGEITQVEESNWLMAPIGHMSMTLSVELEIAALNMKLVTERMNCMRYNQSMTLSIELLIAALNIELEIERMNCTRYNQSMTLSIELLITALNIELETERMNCNKKLSMSN